MMMSRTVRVDACSSEYLRSQVEEVQTTDSCASGSEYRTVIMMTYSSWMQCSTFACRDSCRTSGHVHLSDSSR